VARRVAFLLDRGVRAKAGTLSDTYTDDGEAPPHREANTPCADVLKHLNWRARSGVTHHHHGLVLGNLRKLSGGHPLGPFRPLGGKPRGGQKLSHGGCLDTEVHVLWKWPDCLCYLQFVEL